jgi:hypothetical protein
MWAVDVPFRKPMAAPIKMLQMSKILATSSVQKIGWLNTYLEITPADKVRIIETVQRIPVMRPRVLSHESPLFMADRNISSLFIKLAPLRTYF